MPAEVLPVVGHQSTPEKIAELLQDALVDAAGPFRALVRLNFSAAQLPKGRSSRIIEAGDHSLRKHPARRDSCGLPQLFPALGVTLDGRRGYIEVLRPVLDGQQVGGQNFLLGGDARYMPDPRGTPVRMMASAADRSNP